MEEHALRIRMEGGLEAIEAAGADALRLERSLRYAGWWLGTPFINRLHMADRIRNFSLKQVRVEEATARLERLGAAEGWPGGRPPRCLENLPRARKKLGQRVAWACRRLGGSPSGVLLEDLARVESELRGRSKAKVVDALEVVVPPDPNAPYAPQWRDYRSRRRAGVLLNVFGPLWIVGLAASVSPLALPAFIAWVVANYSWVGWMGRFACPRCKEYFSESHPISPSRCEHCGLARFEGDDRWRRLKA